MTENELAKIVVDFCLKIHKTLGPGLLESVYERCLAYELEKRGLHVARQVPVAIRYDNIQIEAGFRMDLVVDQAIVVEIKSIDRLLPVHEAQLLTYLKLSGYRLGLLINFFVPRLKEGLRRIVHSR